MARPTETKAKQEMVKNATAGSAKGYGTAAAEGSAKAAKSKRNAKGAARQDVQAADGECGDQQYRWQGLRHGGCRRLGKGGGGYVAPEGEAEAETAEPGDERGVEAVGRSPRTLAASRTTRRAQTE